MTDILHNGAWLLLFYTTLVPPGTTTWEWNEPQMTDFSIVETWFGKNTAMAIKEAAR